MNETPNKAESLYAIAHNLKELVEEARKLNKHLADSNNAGAMKELREENERLSENG